ncbi:MAG: zf-HC2 domain-containing protein [Oscillospiraceae bacterium]|nr:zf-HC2 domain-containing protein [Oscillospiraceae bacterium]
MEKHAVKSVRKSTLRCEQMLERISCYVDGELGAKAEAELRHHLKACPPCSDILAAYQAMSAGMRDTEVEPPISLAESVMVRIVGVQPVAAVALVETTRPRRSQMRRFLATAAVFALVGVVGLYGLWSNPGAAEAPIAPMAAMATPYAAMSEPRVFLDAEPTVPQMEPEVAPGELASIGGDGTAPGDQTVRSGTSTSPSVPELVGGGIGLFGQESTDAGSVCVIDLTLFELLLTGETYWIWSDLVEAVREADYYDLLERNGDTFVLENPYNCCGYVYGLIVDHPTLFGEEKVVIIGFHLEYLNRRVEVRADEDGELMYYYAVREPHEGGKRTGSYEDLKRVILFGHVLGLRGLR